MGFGTVIAAPPKALYSAAVKKIGTINVEAESSRPKASIDLPHVSQGKLVKKSILRNMSGGTRMQRARSDPSLAGSRSDNTNSMELKQLKQDLGKKGIGRVLKASIEGLCCQEHY